MRKQDFLSQLRKELTGLPQHDIEECVTFYREMIEDRMEEGLSEEEAVSSVGPVAEIVTQTVADTPLTKIARERISPKRQMKAWEILLLVLGSPIWFSLGIAAVAVVFSLYISMWSVIVSLWAVFGSLAACALSGIAAGILFACHGNTLSGTAIVGMGILCAGLSIIMFCGCNAATKGIVLLTKKSALWTKHRFMKKEVPQ